MNKKQVTEDLWPNNGVIMLQFNDHTLNLAKISNLNYETYGCFLVINTVHEDDLEWEEECVEADLIVCDSIDEFDCSKLKYSNMDKIVDQKFLLGETSRIALASEWDDPIEDGDDFIEFDKNIYSSILLNVFINNDKTKVVFLGLLLE